MSRPVTRTTRLRLCAADGCGTRYEFYRTPVPWPNAFCSAECARRTARARTPAPRARAELVTRPASKRSRPVSVASVEQREKRAAQASIVSGATIGLDAAHLCARARGGCDDQLCTVSLTRAEHTAYDRRELDLLPFLVRRHVAELQHMLGHYEGDVVSMLERLTGCRWVPVRRDRDAA